MSPTPSAPSSKNRFSATKTNDHESRGASQIELRLKDEYSRSRSISSEKDIKYETKDKFFNKDQKVKITDIKSPPNNG